VQLNEGKSVNSIAKKEGVREGTIRYYIDKGRLKKRVV
jgi:DNA-binding NarL/FixJ family response regulator